MSFSSCKLWTFIKFMPRLVIFTSILLAQRASSLFQLALFVCLNEGSLFTTCYFHNSLLASQASLGLVAPVGVGGVLFFLSVSLLCLLSFAPVHEGGQNLGVCAQLLLTHGWRRYVFPLSGNPECWVLSHAPPYLCLCGDRRFSPGSVNRIDCVVLMEFLLLELACILGITPTRSYYIAFLIIFFANILLKNCNLILLNEASW